MTKNEAIQKAMRLQVEVEQLTCQKNACQQVIAERDAEVERLTGEMAAADGLIATLQNLVPHPGDGSCVWCGDAPATSVVLCETCGCLGSESV